ncbi:hypothetical protein [Flavihumibacter sp. CACIAM 22H1]|uniref:hypothetical protein n=1 Tax=Flavihumibacter sp. CACIAM 22H1 TaxID=1812911 RepID=UPI0007A7CC2C|nr:hypothetical protein [Flavihumibacter sp. CACIAM 22H1]KYP14842.1 MAG: hypothetical protein A1D16_03965 [Flavihumibacter sp. CACIAM 22H1]
MRFIFTLFLALVLQGVMAQDITGIWRGHFRQTNRSLQLLNLEDRYRFEVQIAQEGKNFKAVTYSYKTTEFYGKADAKGAIHTGTKKVYLEELKIVDVRMQIGNDACIMTCFLQYTKNGNEEFMEGTYVSMNTRDSSDCGRGTVFLRKVTTSDFYKEPFLTEREKKPKAEESVRINEAPPIARNNPQKPPATGNKPVQPPVKPKPPASKEPSPAAPVIPDPEPEFRKPAAPVVVPPVIKDRENEVVKTFTVTTRQISINLYDNGTIDKDTVSVYLNNRLVVSKKMLSLSPITVNIDLAEENDYVELVMVAENLGEIPPNTSLMLVKAGNKQYEVRITSTEQKNAVVVFKYQRE